MAQPQRESTKRVLAAEVLAQRLLRQSIDRTTAHAKSLGLSPISATLLVQATAALAITKARGSAAAASAAQFEQQTSLEAQEPDDDSEAHAKRAANGIAKAFHEEVSSRVLEGAKAVASYSLVAKALKPSIDRTATTEVMSAWNGETRHQARVAGVEIEQTWHADGGACPVCSQFDGKTVRGDEQFDDGDPPLHPHCRCEISSSVARRSDALDVAEDRINRLGVTNADYLREGMRDLTHHQGAYEGATAAQAEQIATGKAPAINTGKRLPPIKIVVDGHDVILRDGRHRLVAASRAGAQNIRADVVTYVNGRKVERETILSIRGRKQ